MTSIRLAPSSTLPTRPVWWAIQFFDEKTGRLVQSRMSFSKHTDPVAAFRELWGFSEPTPRFIFHNLSSSLAEARKIIRQKGL